jgi:hypothetical protein
MPTYGESIKPLEIDENEELERMTLLKQRETLVRGMGKTKRQKIRFRKNFFLISKVLLICVIVYYLAHRVQWLMYH